MPTPVPDIILQRVLTRQKDLSSASLATKTLVLRLRSDLTANPWLLVAQTAELRG